jgi:hypothetical protein
MLRRQRGDEQPRDPAAVLLATPGVKFESPTLREAVRLADGGPIAVITVALIHGSQFGLPNPGLLPTERERREVLGHVESAIRSLTKLGATGALDGQVAVTRNPAKKFAEVARLRGVSHVVVQDVDAAKWRKMIEGDVVKSLRRRLPEEITVVSPQETRESSG